MEKVMREIQWMVQPFKVKTCKVWAIINAKKTNKTIYLELVWDGKSTRNISTLV